LWRGIAARKPSADFFGGIADFGEWQAVMEITGRWDPANPGPAGSLAGLPRAQWVLGPGSVYLMAPFAFRQPGRFGDGSNGVLYAAMAEATAITEMASGRARFLRGSHAPRETLDGMLLTLALTGLLEDARPLFREGATIYAPDDWTEGQRFGARVRASGTDGILYTSVRRVGQECVAGFRPDLFSGCRPAGSLQFFWDGHDLWGPGGRLA
jgi:hypothetical protein